ncbi:MAG TPA: hypothetical protein VIF62_08695 [Labilithrix sp.]|jgi:hypothetical protein
MRTVHVFAVVLALATAAPAPAAAQEKAPIALVRAPRSLDVPPKAAWIAPEALGSFSLSAPAPREVKLSEEGLVLVVASCIVGAVILVYLVSRAT